MLVLLNPRKNKDNYMNLHEYQSKMLLKNNGVKVPEGIVAYTLEETVKAAKLIQNSTGMDKWVIKAQVHAGGRGKGGGVKVAKNIDEVLMYADQILGMDLVTPQTKAEGKKVRKIYVEQKHLLSRAYRTSRNILQRPTQP